MTFESPLFLTALAAAAVPVVIHLIYRMRKRVVAFGSLRFLERAIRKNRRRLRLRDILLMALRSCAIILIALAFARPRLDRDDAARAGETLHVVFVIDDSLSMSASSLARTRLEEARERVLAEIARLSPRDRAALVRVVGAKVASPLTDDFMRLAAQVRATGATNLPGDMAGALRAAQGVLTVSDAESREIAVASDLQRAGFSDAAFAALRNGAANSVRLIMEPSELSNLSVVSAESEAAYWSPDAPASVRAVIANCGASEVAVPVRLMIGPDFGTRAERTVTVPGGGVATVELAFTPAAAGEFAAVVAIDSGDALAADDERRVTLNLRDGDEVLVISDRVPKRDEHYFRRGAFLDDGAYFLIRALDPHGRDDGIPTSRWVPVEIALQDVSVTALRRARAAALISADTLDRERARLLGDFVRAGGGIVVIARGLNDIAAGLLEEEGLLGAALGRAISSAPLEPFGLPMAEWSREHPVWFAFDAEGGPSRARFLEFRGLEPAEGADTIARAEGGGALAVVAEAGSGRTATLAFSTAPASTDFPKLRSFVPFVHGLFSHVAGGPGSIAPGGGFVVGDCFAASELPQGPSATLTDPDGGQAQVAERAVFDRPGFWRLTSDAGAERWIAVNLPAEESDLRPLSRDEFARAAVGDAGDAPAISGVTSEDAGSREPSRLWAVFMAAAVCMLLCESALEEIA